MRNVSRRKFIAGSIVCAGISAASLSACSQGGAPGAGASNKPVLSATPEKRELWGSPDLCTVRTGLIMGPPSMGLSQFLLAAKNHKTKNNFTFEFNAVDYIGLSARLNNGDFDIATLPSNIGPILYNNHELKNEYVLMCINNLGVLYVMTTDASIKTMDDLRGRTVYAYGAGGTPEYTIRALLKKKNMSDAFNLEFKSTPFEILNLLQEKPNSIALLPQPFISLSKLLVNPLYVPIDITKEWDAAFADNGAQAVMTTTIVNKKFLHEHEQAVIEYLTLMKSSVEWTKQNYRKAAALQEELGSFLNNAVALDAFPHLAICCITGTKMRTAMSGFVEQLYEADPESVGGAIPDDGFYYLPPSGMLGEA